jgi:serine/threonine protein phosphatase PrpC
MNREKRMTFFFSFFFFSFFVMQNPLDKITEQCGNSEDYQFDYASSSMMGRRKTFEDRALREPHFNLKGPQMQSVFAVFDGHGRNGHQIAQYCQDEFIVTLLGQLEKHDPAKALDAAFRELDERLWSHKTRASFFGHGQTAFTVTTPNGLVRDVSTHGPAFSNGTTAVVALIEDNCRVIVANAGDSACFLSRNRQLVRLSNDHKPNCPAEHARIIKAGGTVHAKFNLVCNNLNVARTIGDLEYKRNFDLPPEEQMIIAVPEIISETLGEEDRFIVLVSDGVTDAMTPKRIIDFINTQMDLGLPLATICEMLLNHCYTQHSGDNITCVIVAFEKGKNKRRD